MPHITVNGHPHPLRQDFATVADLVRELSLEGKRIAIEHNGVIVPRGRLADTALKTGDRIEIVGAVGGG